MNEYVSGMMAIVLHLEKRKSSPTAKQIMNEAENGNAVVHIPAIVFAEILYLLERSGLV